MSAKHFIRVTTWAFISAMLLACASTDSLDMAALEQAEISNFRAPAARVLSSGQPTASQLNIASRAGVKHVISLRTAGEDMDFDEATVVESLGMDFHSIPIAVGEGGINTANAASLQELLAAFDGEPVLIHCATGNRVGALMAVSSHSEGASVEAAISEGARWGMTSERLQQLVRADLTSN